jgi:NitT/TauT family transport system ATP-binding protein
MTAVDLDTTALPAPPLTARRSAVRLDGVSKRFRGGPVVLDDVTLDVAPGEFSACSGVRLRQVDAAQPGRRPRRAVRRHGRRRRRAPGADVPGGGAAAVAHGGAERRAAAAAAWRRQRERRARAQELLDLVRLSGSADKRVHELSGGMRQRVALARSLAQDGGLLLMDEPFAALDAITRDVLHEELLRIRGERDLTIIFVTTTSARPSASVTGSCCSARAPAASRRLRRRDRRHAAHRGPRRRGALRGHHRGPRAEIRRHGGHS